MWRASQVLEQTDTNELLEQWSVIIKERSAHEVLVAEAGTGVAVIRDHQGKVGTWSACSRSEGQQNMVFS
jgi:hypothetical protein